MSVLQSVPTTFPRGIGVAETPRILSGIHKPDCAAAIWRRHPLKDFQSWLDGLEPEHLPHARVILRADAAQDAVRTLCKSAGMPDCNARDVLVDDIAAVADIFATVMGSEYLRLRLEVVTTNSCHKLPVDAVTARLICTYRGTGTQYGVSSDGKAPKTIYTVPTCAPIVFRGHLWPTRPRIDLFYRSPPIEGTGESRLVLVLDPVADLEGTHKDQPMIRH